MGRWTEIVKTQTLTAGEGGVIVAEIEVRQKYRQEQDGQMERIGKGALVIRASLGGKRVECDIEEFNTVVKAVESLLPTVLNLLIEEARDSVPSDEDNGVGDEHG